MRLLIALTLLLSAAIYANDDDVTTIHLDQFNGYFAADEVLMGLQPGTYDFVVSNKVGKQVGFLLQTNTDHEQLAIDLIEVDKTKTFRVAIDERGFRYRCPINPTPWYEIDVQAPKG